MFFHNVLEPFLCKLQWIIYKYKSCFDGVILKFTYRKYFINIYFLLQVVSNKLLQSIYLNITSSKYI